MSDLLTIVEGWTGNLDFQLNTDGAAQDLTASTVTLILRSSRGVLVDTSSSVSVLSPPTAGKVRYIPAANDLKASKWPYRARFKVIKGGQTVLFPSGEADNWTVVRE